MRGLVIIGAGGHGKVVADIAEQTGMWKKIEFVDARFPTLKCCGYWPVVAKDTDIDSLKNEADFVVAIGNNFTRKKVQTSLKDQGYHLVSVVHPSALISSHCNIGPGSVVFAGAVVNIDASLGEGCIVNTSASIDHDCKLGPFVHVSPGARLSGNVKVGEASWVGVGAVIRQEVSVGKGVIIGAGAAVVSDLGDGITAIGIPAKENKKS